jgi:hypothetical protein
MNIDPLQKNKVHAAVSILILLFLGAAIGTGFLVSAYLIASALGIAT